LNAAAIEVALLKGTRLVLDKRTPFSQGRVLRDIDLLVPAEKWKRAGSILEGTGYRRGGAAPHAITYVAANGGVEVDLHREPLWLHKPLGLPDYLTAEGFWRRAAQIEGEGVRWYSLPPAENLIHSILHTEVADLNFAAGDWALRYLYETAIVSRRTVNACDWSALEIVQGHDIRVPLLAHLCTARRLFGAEIPASVREDWRSRRHFHRCRINILYPRSVRRASILVYKFH